VAFQSAPDVAEAVIKCVTDGQSMANVINFAKPGGYNSADIAALAGAVDGVVGAAYLALMHNTVVYGETLVRGLEFENDITAVSSGAAGNGTGGAVTLPSNVSFVVTLRSGFTGRSARGRLYLMPMSSSSLVTANNVTTTFALAAVNMLGDMKAAGLAVGWTMCILSRFKSKAKRAVATYFVVNTIEARNTQTDSQRGRLPKGH